MSDGKTHSASTIGLSIGLSSGYVLSYFNLLTPEQIGITVVGSLFQILVSPDQDVDEGNISDYYIRKFFFVDYLWANMWRPYRLAFRHRSILSHGPIIGTVIRLVYMLCPFIAVVLKDQDTTRLELFIRAIVSQILALPFITLVWFFWPYLPYFFVGMVLGDLLHLIFDM